MPRKAWKQKNRYCWNSNLSEEMFLVLLRLYCAGYSCTHAARVIARYARRFGGTKISRQTINRYYLMLGDTLYEMLPDGVKPETFPLEPGGDMPADEREREEYIAGRVLSAIYHGLYERLTHDDPINQIIISNKTVLIHDVLKAFSKQKRGYPARTFSTHYAFCAWFFLTFQPGKPGWKTLYEIMRGVLEVQPLDVRYNRSLRFAQR